jgi:Domain of unknown function (DUF4296)
MKPVALIFSFLFILGGCKKKNAVPNGILPPPVMQAVLWDMMRADQFLADYVLNKDTSKNKKNESIKMYEQIFGFHKINKEQFKRSYSYYRSKPLLLKEIMDSIQSRKVIAPTYSKQKDSIVRPVDTIISPASDSARRNKGIRALPID